MQELIKYGINKDMVFLVLFILSIGAMSYLVRWTLVTSKEREERYITTIEKLTGKLDKLDIIELVLNDIKQVIRR